MDHRDHRSATLQGRDKGHGSRYRGYLHFRDDDKKPQFAIVSVKGGENINSAMVRDLKRAAASAGLYETGGHEGPQASNPHGRANPRQPAAASTFGFTEGFKKAGREEASQDRLL